LEMEGNLGSSQRWRALLPSRSSFFEATTRFSRQLFGREAAFIKPNEVTNTGKKTGFAYFHLEWYSAPYRQLHADDERGNAEHKELK